jgi:nucleotide-binding universal stress UspA family protein
MTYRHLLVPIDGSALSQHAIDASIALARKLEAAITALIVEPPAPVETGYSAAGSAKRMQAHARDIDAHARRVCEAFGAQAERAGLAFDAVCARSTHVVEAIIAAASERQCDLVVMATHLHGRLDELFGASNTKAMLARSKLPVLVLH